MMSKYAEIIERLEKAQGPNYALEVEIFKLMNPEYADFIQGRGGLIHPQDGEDVRVISNVRAPNYTASVDAALALVERMLPAKPLLMGRGQTELTMPWARVGSWSGCDAVGSTLPIAILLALFRVLEAKENAG